MTLLLPLTAAATLSDVARLRAAIEAAAKRRVRVRGVLRGRAVRS